MRSARGNLADTLLQLLLNPISQRDEATDGFESIPFIVRRYQVIERLRRPNAGNITRKQADTDALVTDLENKMVQLYSKVLEYEMRLMRQSSHMWALRYGRDVFKADEWKNLLSQIQELDSICSRVAGELGQEELETGMKENNVKVDILLQSWTAGLQGLQEQGMNTYIALDAHAGENRSWREREEFRKLLHALRTKNPYQNQIERTPTRQVGTCNWFLNNAHFQTWRKDAHSRLLWVSANPGCGKSVLSKCLVEEKLATLDPQHATICYFFFKDVSPDSRSITKAFSAILHQLFTKIPGLAEHAVSAFDENGDELSSMFSTMWEILENAASDTRAGEIVCVLDALDECEEAQQITLVEKLKTFYSKAEDSKAQKQKLRFLLTSRPYRNIRAQFNSLIRRFPTIHLSGDDESDLIKDEIDLVIHSEVAAIASERCFHSETEAYLLKQLLKIENRTYLWLHLILDQIRNSDNAGNEKAIRKEIETIPQSVSRAYEAILAKAKDRNLASKLLHIIVGAETTLTLQELNVAMSIEDDSRSYKDLDMETVTAFELRVKSICGLFIYTDRSKVFLIHQTAKEFLQWNQEVSEPATGIWEHSLKPEESNSLLADICVSLLMFDDLETDPLPPGGLDGPVSNVEYEQYCDAHVFLKYAAEFWIKHLNSSPLEKQNALFKKTTDLCNLQSRRSWTWPRVKEFAEDDTLPSGFTDLILASYSGLVAVVKLLVSKKCDVNAMDHEGATALNRAMQRENVDVIRILLDSGADIEAGGDWDTPWLEEIDDDGSEREVKQFSERPLMVATLTEDHGMMRMLLAAGADRDARGFPDGRSGETALHAATRYGEKSTMCVLLDNGADVNARTGEPNYVERKAQRKLHGKEEPNGDGPVLRKDVVNGSHDDPSQVTALQIAVWKDDAAKVRLLLDYGANPEAEFLFDDEDHETKSPSLQSDKLRESTSIPVSPNHEHITCEGSTPGEDVLHTSMTDSDQAGFPRHDDSSESKLLSGDGVESLDPTQSGHATDDVGSHVEPYFDSNLPPAWTLNEWENAAEAISKMTLIDVAASRGDEDVVRLLLQHVAIKRPEPTASSEPTALHLAALVGPGQVVKMLLDQTVDVNPKDHHGATPLHAAVWRGYGPVVNEHLEHGVDINSKDNNGATPLHIAVSMRYGLVVSDLLDYGADLYAEDNAGDSPLLLAALRGYDEIVRDFIHYGVNLNVKNHNGTTALHMATLNGHDRLVKELLSRDVDLNTKDRIEGTPLHVAAQEGHGHVVKELLFHGVDVNAKGRNEETPLHMAAHNGYDQVVKELLDFDADVKARNRDGATPLHLAAETGQDQVVKQLLGHNADVNTRNRHKDTPLHMAAHNGHDHVVKELLVFDADVNARNTEKLTPLHLAAARDVGRVVKQLLDYNADFRHKTEAGHTALDLAVYRDGHEAIPLLLGMYPQDSAERQRFYARDPRELERGRHPRVQVRL